MKSKIYLHVIMLFMAIGELSAQSSFLKIYPGQLATNPNFYINSVPTCMERSSSGSFFIGGYTSDPDTLSLQKMQLRKIDSQGNEVWNIKDRVTNFDEIDDLLVYNDSVIFCAVRLGSQVGLVKRNFNGQIEWSKNLLPDPDTCSGPNAIIKTHDGNLLLCGSQYRCTDTDGEILLIKVDTTGSVIWRKRYDMPWDNSAGDIVELKDSTLIMVGGTDEIDSNHFYTKSFLCKLDAAGDIEWFKTYGTAQAASCIVVLPDSTFGIGNGIDNYFLQTSNDGLFFTVDDTGGVIDQFMDTLAYENFIVKLKRRENTIFMLEYASSGLNNDTSINIRLLKYDVTSHQVFFVKTFGLMGLQQPKDMEVLDNGYVAITFFESDTTCQGCTGLVVLDSTGCVYEWCYTGIEELGAPEILAYPNPFAKSISVKGIQDANATITVFNFNGTVVYRQKHVIPDAPLQLPDLLEGVYFMQIEDGTSRKTIKLICLH